MVRAKRLVGFLMMLFLVFSVLAASAAGSQETAKGEETKKLVIGLGDIESVETLNLLIALEKVKEQGIQVELVSFKSEDIGSQAVVNGQADIGIGTPYSVIQNVQAPIRIFYRLSTLVFFPVVNKEHYTGWKDLNGQEMVVHSRTSGTLALANLWAQQNGIQYSGFSYVPGSEVRALAMLQGNIKATILDVTNKDFLMKKAPDKFLVLPTGEATASDEALFAREEFLKANPTTVNILLTELIKTWRQINADPAWVLPQRQKYGLLKDLPKDLEPEILPYYQLGASTGMFPNDGGGAKAARQDIDFYATAGQIKGDPATLKVEDFWYLEPLNKALEGLK